MQEEEIHEWNWVRDGCSNVLSAALAHLEAQCKYADIDIFHQAARQLNMPQAISPSEPNKNRPVDLARGDNIRHCCFERDCRKIGLR